MITTSKDPFIGTYIGPYLIESFVGRGGMGSVYKAYQETLDRSVAIKLLRTEEQLESDQLHRFREEARSASKCKHPNIIVVYDFGIHENHLPYMVMELLEGESLKELIVREKTLSPLETLQILVPVAQALHVMHTQGLIHRDVKPGNVFIEKNHGEVRVKVLDFGLAFLIDSVDDISTVIGTPAYMAPEQILRNLPSPKTDVYALAALAYYCLSGQSPIANHTSSIQALIERANNTENLTELSSIGDFSQAISDVVKEGMSYHPEDRPKDTLSFVQNLYKAIQSGANLQVPPDFLEVNKPMTSLLFNLKETVDQSGSYSAQSLHDQAYENQSSSSPAKLTDPSTVKDSSKSPIDLSAIDQLFEAEGLDNNSFMRCLSR